MELFASIEGFWLKNFMLALVLSIQTVRNHSKLKKNQLQYITKI